MFIKKKKKERTLSGWASGRKCLKCVGPPDPYESCCDCSITPVMCLQVFGNRLDVYKLIDVTFGVVL